MCFLFGGFPFASFSCIIWAAKSISMQQRMIYMLEAFWKSLKSGTDIRGAAMENDRGEPVRLTDEAVRRMAGGFLCWMQEHLGLAAGGKNCAGT